MEQEILQTLLTCIEKHPEESDNKKWFIRLIQNSLSGNNDPEIDIDLIHNATVIENILANMLSIDIRTIVKIRLVHKTICTLWEENGGNLEELNNYILENKPMLINTSSGSTEDTINNQQDPTTTPLEEAPFREVEMAEGNQISLIEMEITTENEGQLVAQESDSSDDMADDVTGENITNITNYNTRNRTQEPTNPFFITRNKDFCLGVLAANTPGDNKKSQRAYVTNMLKLPPNSILVQFEFWNGNRWFTVGFDYEEDLKACKEKLNRKEKDLIKFIQLRPKDNGKKEKTENKKTIEINIHKKQLEPTMTIKPLMQDQANATNEAESNKEIQRELNNNPYGISQDTTIYRGGFLAVKIPGENRKEQLDMVANILKIPPTNNLIIPIFHEGNSWIIAHFPNQEKLAECINRVNNQGAYNVNMIALSNNNRDKKGKGKETYKDTTCATIKPLGLTKIYKIMDIPREYSNDRIKGALKPFGQVVKLEPIEAKSNTKEKTIQVTIEPLTYSKGLANRWSIPLGSTMVRICSTETTADELRDRNQYMTRLYGIPQATNTVGLMHSIRNLKPKTCYIPKCSRTGKNRNFAIISFQTKEELDKACISSARYSNHRLTWSKSRKHHIETLEDKETRFLQRNNNKYIQESIWENTSTISSSDYYKGEKIKGINRRNKYIRADNDNNSENKISTPTSNSYTPSINSSSSKEWYKTNVNQHKGKSKKISSHDGQENNTMSKIIAMMSQIASRLEIIETNMGNLPNRS